MFFTANIHNLTLDKAEQKFMSSQSWWKLHPLMQSFLAERCLLVTLLCPHLLSA